MPTVVFNPIGTRCDVEPNTKILAAATRNKVAIRFGCASCRCGTCGVAVSGDAELTPMRDDEKALLTRMGLATSGGIRLACQTRVTNGTALVDLSFQNTYSPDEGNEGIDDTEADE